ncbi:MAG TPA: aminofutalosine synthase MqnE [Chitinophagales bacterium]|nr:aminofutalosine synthase MqnE [Chitinophagales bacterium]
MTETRNIEVIIETNNISPAIKSISAKILDRKRISIEEGLILYNEADLGLLGSLANFIREKLHGNKTFFNRNFHIEPTNKCVFDCKFCSYARNFQQEEDAWELNGQQMIDMVKKYDGIPITEVHIVGGVHPKMNLYFFADLIRKIKLLRPDLHVKAFTAVELEYMFRKSKLSYEEGLKVLKDAGMDSIPGGGAEIFHDEIRNIICKDKATTEEWLGIHEAAHRMGMHSNCTMLYGHIENYFHRLHHMSLLRELQDKTQGFNCFIPLKFRNKDNEMSNVSEATIIEDLRCYAMSRIFIDNIPHLKAYWPMIGRSTAQLLLQFGVDDLDGTIDDSTKIYSMAGAEEQHPAMSTKDIVELIKQVNRKPVERDTLYNELKDYTGISFEEEKKPFVELPILSN